MKRVLAAFCVLMAPGVALGATVFEQAPPLATSRASDFNAPFVNQEAQRFSFAADTTVTGVQVWGHYTSGLAADDFTVRFFNDAAGAPETVAFSSVSAEVVTRVDIGESATGGQPIYLYSLNLPAPQSFSADVDYYISIVNDTSRATAWFWQSAPVTNDLTWNRGGSPTDNDPWGTGTGNLAFRLSDSVFVTPQIPTLSFGALVLLALFLGLTSRRALLRRS